MKALLIAVLLVIAAREARADELAVGLYAPSAPFVGTSARLDYVSDLAAHLGAELGDEGTGKVFARASDFAAAARGGTIDLAVVDAAYLAALGVPYTVLATATRGGDDGAVWQLVSRGGESRVAELKGKKLLCPSVGGRESDFVYNALLGGELERGFFSVSDAPDAASALTALELGRADAAVVPGGLSLPGGVTVVTTLPRVGWPVLVAIGKLSDSDRKKLVAAATSYGGGDVLGRFRAGGADDVRALGRRFGKGERRGPMVIPNLRVAVDELVAGRKHAIERVDVKLLFVAPPPLPPPGT